MEPITAVIVCVEYDDLLAITLPHNRPFFDHVIVVTTPEDVRTQAICVANNAKCLTTRVFYERGAAFNKGAALERGFDLAGREGWFAVLDADILIPHGSVIQNIKDRSTLEVPRRRIIHDVESFDINRKWIGERHDDGDEFAGYCQVFHSSAEPLKYRPWYPTNWKTCGGCDSIFARKWPIHKQQRPPYIVYHLGPVERNWAGRTTTRTDGTVPPDAPEKAAKLAEFMQARESAIKSGKRGWALFERELIDE